MCPWKCTVLECVDIGLEVDFDGLELMFSLVCLDKCNGADNVTAEGAIGKSVHGLDLGVEEEEEWNNPEQSHLLDS